SGFGRDLTIAALKRGDKVLATARDVSRIQDLKELGADTLKLDVTDTLDNLNAVAKEGVAIHGRVDVIVNNAGYILAGTIEESTPEESYAQFNTNVFGVLNVTRAFLPYMRERRSGTVITIGSVGGWGGAINIGLYCATKFTIRGITESLALELEPFGIRALCIEPGYFRTAFLKDGNRGAYVSRIPDYQSITGPAEERLRSYNGKQPGDPVKFVEVMLDVVRGEGVAAGRKIPTVLPLGSDCYNGIQAYCAKTLGVLEEWKDVIVSTDFPKGT
ncbi:hypothetical protein FRC02_007407, partial [Tulasnella sp. 418]